MVGTISAGATSFICTTWKWALFPSTFPFLLTLEAWTGWVVTKREKVRCTGRSVDTFTIVRSAGYCPASDSASSQTNTAFSFDPTAETVTVKLSLTAEDLDDINAEIARLLAVEIPLKLNLTGGALSGLLNEVQWADIPSATTTNLATATGNSVKITGTTTITGFGTVQNGTCMKLTFTGILTLTYNATSMILPKAGSNITTASGDSGVFISLGSGNWKCVSYQKADGTALVSTSAPTADTSTPGIIEISDDTEFLAETATNRAVTPAQMSLKYAMFEQQIGIVASTLASVGDNLRITSETDGSAIFIATQSATSDTLSIRRYARNSTTGKIYLTHTAAFTSVGNANWSNWSLAVVGSYLYVVGSSNSGGTAQKKRFDKADLANATTLTVSGTGWANGNACTTDGTDLLVFESSDTFRRYTISGTTITNAGTVTFTSAGGVNNGSCIWDGTYIHTTSGTVDGAKKYNPAGGSAVSSLTGIATIQSSVWPGQSTERLFVWKTGVLGYCLPFQAHSNSAEVGLIGLFAPWIKNTY